MKQIGRILALGLLAAVTGPALGADPVYPPGVRVGMVPLVGLAPAKTFTGFETEDHGVQVLVTELPAADAREVETVNRAYEQGGGVTPERIESAACKAYYTAENAKDGSTVFRSYSMI